MLFNKYSFHDDLRYLYTGGVTFTSGRWMLYIVEKVKNVIFQDSLYSIPVVNGIFTFFCIAVSSCLLIDLFNIRSTKLCVLQSGIMVSIPVVTCMFGYMFTAQFFALAILFAVSGAFLILKKNNWYCILLGILLSSASIGIYQAYISIFISVIIFGLIKQFSEIDCQEKQLAVYKKTIICIISLVSSLVVYWLLMNFFLRINGLELGSYLGMNEVKNQAVTIYLQRIPTLYREFIYPEISTPYNVLPGVSYVIYMVFVVLFVFLSVLLTIRVFKSSRVNGIIFLLLELVIPICVKFEFIMIPSGGCYAMMVYADTLFFVFLIWLFEKNSKSFQGISLKYIKYCLYIGLFLIVSIFFRFDNVCYTRLEMAHTAAIRYYTSLVTRMQIETKYDTSMPVAYIGDPQVVRWDPTVPENDEFGYVKIYPYFPQYQMINDTFRLFMEIWFNFKPREIDPAYFTDMLEVQEMPAFPAGDSIKVINDTLVVKFIEN